MNILIIVENLPVPFDRRVWQEAKALRENGYAVSVICPRSEQHPELYESRDGINIYRHPLFEAKGKWGYFIEYPMALFFEFLLAFWIFLSRSFHCIHACNPPDLIWIVALPFRWMGVRFVFDHHDINPELFETKFGKKGFFYDLLIWLEKQSFQLADRSIATNQSYANVAVERGGMPEEHVHVVRSAPDLAHFDELIKKTEPRREPDRIKVGYVGVMGDQEGIDLLLKAAKKVREQRSDVVFTLVGDGPARKDLEAMRDRLGLEDAVRFTGRVSDEELVAELSGADLCVNPDRATPMNDKSTMNKIMEYMALEKPIVQFDLTEGRRSAGESSLYARKNDPEDLANNILNLAADPEKRKRMGRIGRKRLEDKLSWEQQKEKLVELYEHLPGDQNDQFEHRSSQK